MVRSALTGTRIRERRMRLGLRQADLARSIGVSPSYLNLIEHNRRPAGAGLVAALAQALGVEEAALTEGAQAALIEALREAAADRGEAVERIEDFISRFPGWADLLAVTHRRVAGLERTVERLTDRLTHDPYLSASLHEVLSAVTSLRATAAILAETEDLEPQWCAQFHRNLQGDSVRLAEGAGAMVAYLDAVGAEDSGRAAPMEEVEAWLERDGPVFAAMEEPGKARAPAVIAVAVIAGAPELATGAARALAVQYLEGYARDAAALPLAAFRAAVQEMGPDPARLAARFGVDLGAVFRRIAVVVAEVGVVVCDGSGTLTFRKPLAGFGLPRFGAGCPLWPLYTALSRPTVPIRALVEMPGRGGDGRGGARFLSYAVCQSVGPVDFEGPQVLQATMLVLPAKGGGAETVLQVGSSCRICPRAECPARREPSILAEGF